MLPMNLVLVRHGESEGNIAKRRSEAGEYGDLTPEFLNRHSVMFRLTDKGRAQAESAGAWLKQNGLSLFGLHIVSECDRAMETAALLDLPCARWHVDFRLRERDYGIMDIVPPHIRREKFAEYGAEQKRHAFYAPLPGGESMADVCERLHHNIIRTIRDFGSGANIIIVSHGEVMRAFRVILEHMTANAYHTLDKQDPPWFKIGNVQVIHYTRMDPNDPRHIRREMGWVRSVNPFSPTYAGHDWREIPAHQTFSNEDLLALVARNPRMINR
jgi:NAD+ kinase